MLKSTDLHHGFQQIKQWQKTSVEKSDSFWDSLCCSQHHISIISTKLQKQTQGKTPSSTPSPWVDVWHLPPPTFPKHWNWYLSSNTQLDQLCLTWTIPFSLSGEEYHLQWYLFWTFFWKNIPSLPPPAFFTLFLACGISTCVFSPCLDLNNSCLIECLDFSWQLWALQLSQCHS